MDAEAQAAATEWLNLRVGPDYRVFVREEVISLIVDAVAQATRHAVIHAGLVMQEEIARVKKGSKCWYCDDRGCSECLRSAMDAEARQRAEEIHRLLLKAAPLVEGTAYGPSIRRDTAVLIEQATPLLEQYVADAVAQAIKEKTDEADKYHMLLCVEIGRTKAQAEEIARLGRDIEAHKLEIVRCRADVAEALRREPAWTDRQSGISMTLDGGEGDDC